MMIKKKKIKVAYEYLVEYVTKKGLDSVIKELRYRPYHSSVGNDKNGHYSYERTSKKGKVINDE